MNGKILNVQRFCTKDGPGIRTTVFFKGCPLECAWCHNPESQSVKGELMYNAEKCVNCLRCVDVCPQGAHSQNEGRHVFDCGVCTACGKCLSPLCEALELAGYEASADELLDEVMQDRLYYENSGGGLTLSGGEPLFQPDFCAELLEKAKARGLHVCMETCGYASREALLRCARFVDLFLFDFKESDPQQHRRHTRVDNRIIIENLRFLDALGKATVLRCPIIPDINDREDHILGIASLANSLKNITEIVIEPYHTLGVGKYERLGRAYDLFEVEPLGADAADRFISRLSVLTSVPVRKA
ncbi:MAG: glycyl-radical enzyme activating protein [Clostridia bacterium]|nr:glycyl-radical enzyme activating protein [Clostridia bacterium]